jgi:hypothetical protein
MAKIELSGMRIIGECPVLSRESIGDEVYMASEVC